MPISRTTWTDDSGGGIDGTILNNAQLQLIYDAIEANTLYYVNDTANANMTVGITINQGAADDEILCLKSSDVTHGVTDLAETDSFAIFKKNSGLDGCLQITGFSQGTAGMLLQGIHTTDDTAKSTSARGCVVVRGQLKSGSTAGGLGANANILTVDEAGTTRFIIDVEGDIHKDGTDNTFDAFEDDMLALAWEHAMNPTQQVTAVFNQWCRYNADDLVAAGILHPADPNTGRRFYNESALTRLAIGGLWKAGVKIRQLEMQVTDLQRRLTA